MRIEERNATKESKNRERERLHRLSLKQKLKKPPFATEEKKTHLLLAVALVSGTCPATRARRHLAEEKKRKKKKTGKRK